MQNNNNKICITAISLGKGGAERSAAMLSQMLDELGYEVHLAILNDEIDFPYAGALLNLGTLKKEEDSLMNRYSRFRHFRKYLQKNNINLIIDHRPKNQYFRELFYDHYIYKDIAKIYVTHSSKLATYLTENPKKFVKLCNKNKANVAVSHYIEENILQTAGVQNTKTIYNTFDPAWKKQSESLPEELKNIDYLLSYGRLNDSIKDFQFLMQSFSASKLWERGIHLVIMGDGTDKEMLQEKAKTLSGGAQILFLPFTSEPFGVIKNARYVTLTSQYEGFPMVLVESLSLGTPVVSLDIVSGPSEIVVHGENGLLIAKREVPLFSESLVRMYDDNTLYERCKTNAKTSVERFAPREIAKQWQEVINHE